MSDTFTVIENDDKSILYTGDIRSEPSFITKLCQSPYLIQYTTQLRTLDCLYLDTSNLGSDMLFPSQADGLGELLQKVTKYPKDTIFHISAWTYGYEKVWMALSRMLNCQVHLEIHLVHCSIMTSRCRSMLIGIR